jgi:hypothetical protein
MHMAIAARERPWCFAKNQNVSDVRPDSSIRRDIITEVRGVNGLFDPRK